MSLKYAQLVAVCLSIPFLTPSVHAQSLSDVAKKAAADRERRGGTPSKTYSNKDLPGAPSEALPPPPTSPGKWRRSQDQSKMDDSRTVLYMLDAENSATGWLRAQRPTLIARCKEHSLEAYISTGMSARPELGMHDAATVRIRLDGDVAKEEVWGESTSNSSLFSPDPYGFLRRVAFARQLLFQFTPFNATPQTIEFDVAGLNFSELLAACPQAGGRR